MKEAALRLVWPQKGLHEATSYDDQPPGTSPGLRNVRAFNPRNGRLQGGQRAGLSKYLNAQLSGSNRIQDIIHVTQASGTPSATQQNIRAATAVAVSNGTIAKFTSSAFTTATGGSSALSSTVAQIFSTVLLQQIYYCDGTSYKVYDPGTNTVTTWEATDELNEDDEDGGEMPFSTPYRCRLIETYRNRIVLSGLKSDPQNWYMSAVGYPLDWNYGPKRTCPTQAVAGNNTDAGRCPDIINTMIPVNDDNLIFGGDRSIWLLRGDPAEQGRIDRISDTIGMAWGRPWCIDPSGMVYFFGSRGGVFRMPPAALPERISAGIDERLAAVNLNTTAVRLAWNDKEQGVHLFLSPLTAGTSTHYYYDARNQSWWPDVFASSSYNPVAVHVFDSDDPNDRTLLLGGEDGRIRKWDSAVTADDGTAISSYAWLGPIAVKGSMRRTLLKELQATLMATSGDVDWEVIVGHTLEEAFTNGRTIRSGTWGPGPNPSNHARANFNAIFLKLSSDETTAWNIESIEAAMAEVGRAFQRRGA